MDVFSTVHELKSFLGKEKQLGKIIGFVPTMGALHLGHLSLVDKAFENSDIVVVSIFVNPTQFNNPNDLKSYPRDLEKDLGLLSATGCNVVFAPSSNEVYPEPDTRLFEFGDIDTVMEGKHRPGHFNGVAQVVSKLFEMVEPDFAYFGLKDFQQLAIIKNLVKQLNSNVKIVSCPTIRESDGLAMSSRNMLLTDEQRKNAALISSVLFEAIGLSKQLSVKKVKEWVVETINKNPFLDVEYFDIVDDEKLKGIEEWDSIVNKVGCIAVHCGRVRLIDNVIF